MFAKLKEKIQKEGGAVSDGERSLPALPGHASPRRVSTTGSPAQSPLTRDRSSDDLGALSSDDNLNTDASKEDLYAALQRRTEQCRKLETRVNEYAAFSKDNTKKIEKLENFIEKQQDAIAKRTQELNEQFQNTRVKMTDKFKEELEEKEKEKQELINKLKALEIKHKGFYKKEEEKEEIQGFATQELGKLKHMVILKEEELAKYQAELAEKTQKLEEEQRRNKELTIELTSLQEKLTASETTRLKLEADSVEHGRIVSALTKERINLEQSLSETKTQLTETTGSLSALHATYTELENTHQTLARNFDQHKNKSSQMLQEKGDQVEQLQDRLKLLEQRESDQTLTGDERVHALEKEREGLERKLSETREQLSQVKSSWSDKISHLEEQISHLNLKIVEDNEELAQAKKTADLTRETLQKEIDQLKERLTASERQAQVNLDLVDSKESHFKKERLDLETEISKLKLEKINLDTQLRARITSLESQITALETAKAQETAELEQQLINHKEQVQDLQHSKSSLDQKLVELQKNSDILQIKVEQLEKAEAGLKSSLSDKEQQLGELQNQNKQLEEEISTARSKLSSVQENSKSTATELAESNKDKDELMLRNAELSQKLTALQRSSSEERVGLEEELRSKSDTESALQQQCDALQVQVKQLNDQQSEQVSSSDQVSRLQETVTVLEEQLADRNKALKKQEQKINDLKKTLHRELKVQSLPNDEPIDPKMAALTPPLARKNSTSRNPQNTDSSRARRQNSHERSPAPGDTGYNFSDNSNVSQDYFLGQSSNNHGLSGKPNMYRLPHPQDHATISVNDIHGAFHAGAYGTGVVNYGDSRTGKPREIFETKHLEKDVNFQYLKHVVMKFVLSREAEAIQLIKAISLLLRFTPEEQKLMRDTLEWKMSWFGGSQPPAIVKGHSSKIIPPSY